MIHVYNQFCVLEFLIQWKLNRFLFLKQSQCNITRLTYEWCRSISDHFQLMNCLLLYTLSQVFASTTFCLIIGSKNIKRWKNFDLNWFQLLNTDRYVYLFIIKMGQTRNSKKRTLIRILNFKIICYSLPKVTDLITFWHILRIICILVIKESLKSIQGLNLLLPTQKN